MPPTNDNWASAKLVSGASGQTSGTNIGATAEAGEPSNNGKTVWYKWVATRSDGFAFNTLFNALIGSLSSPLTTVLRVYTGVAVNALTEVAYINVPVWHQRYANWDLGSLVAFDTTIGTIYYIRVDGVGGVEGNFALSWGLFYLLTVGGCPGCPPQTDLSLQCLGVIQLPNLANPSTTSWGTFPAGCYHIQYCAGCTLITDPPDSGWTIYDNDDPFTLNGLQLDYFSGGAAASIIVSDNGAFKSQPECENANRCLAMDIIHSGGDIALEITQPFGPGHTDTFVDGNPNPTFGLYKPVPALSFVAACASWVTPGSSATCVFTVNNRGSSPWTGVTATLDASGGIGGSSTVTGITLNRLSNTSFTITFNASDTQRTATLRLSHTCWPSDVVFVIFLGPILTIPSFPSSLGAGGFGSCSGVQLYNLSSALIRNSGFWKLTGTQGLATIVFNSGVGGVSLACAITGTLNLNFTAECGSVASPGLGFFTGFRIHKPGVTTPTKLTIILKDSTTTFATLTENVTVN